MRTALLMALMTGILSGLGNYFGGLQGFQTMLIFSVGMNLLVYWNCDKMVLAQYHAIQVDEKTAPGLYGTVKKLATRAGLPMPRVYIVNSDVPNAFATGRNPEHAVVCVNRGLANMLNQEELEGVLSHELTHVKNRDILISTVAATMAGMITTVARWGMFFGGGRDENGNSRNPIVSILIMVLAPIAAALVQMGISRSREYLADEGGGNISGNPNALADALLKIESYAKNARPMAYATENTAHMFIINPFAGVNMKTLFSTHPATADRVKRLREQAAKMGK
ncbi:MAG: zinc metalloprotease HtpX [Acidaminococcaceae bacterium]|nr:zinc metalloprotease HtpX [Acidaminococcaceae bacterium]